MPADLLPDAFSEAARILAEGLTPARAWKVVQKYCSSQCLMAWGQGEEIRCSCRCQARFGTMLHGYFRDHPVACVADESHREIAPEPVDDALFGISFDEAHGFTTSEDEASTA